MVPPWLKIERLWNVKWTTIGFATVDGAVRDRYWIAWQRHCRLFSGSRQTPEEPPVNVEDMLLTFAVAVQEGQYGFGRQIQVQSVAVALRAVTQKYVLDGHADHRWASPAQHSLNLPIARLIKKGEAGALLLVTRAKQVRVGMGNEVPESHLFPATPGTAWQASRGVQEALR
jgi:hypothetical protein